MKRTLGCLAVLSLFLCACAQHGALPATPATDAPAARPVNSAFRVVYNFGVAPDAAFPSGPLVNVKGTLYGITSGGGSHNGGTLFSVDSSGSERVLQSFPGYNATYSGPSSQPSALTELNGTLYGVTTFGGAGKCTEFGVHVGCGTLFRYAPGGAVRTIHDFTVAQAIPSALTSANGVLYGATSSGIYSSTPAGKIHVIDRFPSYAAVGALLIVGRTLYGTLAANNYANPPTNGSVFALTLSGKMSTIYTFKGGSDGQSPAGSVIYVNGALYGTTQAGGTGKCQPYNGTAAIGCGTIYRVTLSGSERVLHSFTGSNDGSFPAAGLSNIGGLLYGTASGAGFGAAPGIASLFRITPAGALTILRTWARFEEQVPEGGVTLLGGSLFSTTANGGTFRRGTIISFAPTDRI